jgi:hypothetical protein
MTSPKLTPDELYQLVTAGHQFVIQEIDQPLSIPNFNYLITKALTNKGINTGWVFTGVMSFLILNF